MGKDSRVTGPRTDQASADKITAEITTLFSSYLDPDISDRAWMMLQDSLYRLVLKAMRDKNYSEKA